MRDIAYKRDELILTKMAVGTKEYLEKEVLRLLIGLIVTFHFSKKSI